MEKIKKECIEILKKYTFNQEVWENFNDKSSIIDDLKINSARIVDIIIDIEEKYNIEITDDELDKLKCFQDIVELIKSKI
ncbi:MAG: phosphopantetheine-binding protein [Bacteroidales bacterium]|jgi:acyl carrier protein|nr:phosphopantetheine-binding protein [Bacteroidales bacterium]HQB21409.1 phosphopantetheine-binding protein [Bacteroidales bacterium]